MTVIPLGLSRIFEKIVGPETITLVPGLLKGAAVAIIPFRLSALTHDVSALKLYEYLAASLPVVSTPLREVKASRAPVTLDGSALEFTRGLDEALALRKDRQEFAEFAAENTCEKKLESIESILVERALPGCSS